MNKKKSGRYNENLALYADSGIYSTVTRLPAKKRWLSAEYARCASSGVVNFKNTKPCYTLATKQNVHR